MQIAVTTNNIPLSARVVVEAEEHRGSRSGSRDAVTEPVDLVAIGTGCDERLPIQ